MRVSSRGEKETFHHLGIFYDNGDKGVLEFWDSHVFPMKNDFLLCRDFCAHGWIFHGNIFWEHLICDYQTHSNDFCSMGIQNFSQEMMPNRLLISKMNVDFSNVVFVISVAVRKH